MDPSFIPVEVVPSKTPFGLDQLRRSYKTSLSAEAAIAAAPAIFAADEAFATMFLSSATTPESAASATRVELLYLGSFTGDMPAQKATSSGQVASATTNTSSAIFPATATNPASVQFYAITNVLSFFSNDPADASAPDDPPEIDDLITWDLGFGVQPGLSKPDLVAFLLTEAFIQAIIEPQPEIEPIIDGELYQITKRKTRTLQPYAPPS